MSPNSRLERLPFTKKDSRPAPQASKKGRRVPERRRALSAGVEDFFPWAAPISSHPLASEEEEEEDEMADHVQNFGARKCKQGASFKLATDATPEVVGEVDHHPTGRGSEEQMIVVMDSPEMGFHGQSSSEIGVSTGLREVPLTHEEAWEGILSKRIANRPDKVTSFSLGTVGHCFPTGCY